jgi:hypothetical protein
VEKMRSTDLGPRVKKNKRKQIFPGSKSKFNLKNMKKKKITNDSKMGPRSKSFVGPEKMTLKKGKVKKKKTKETRGKSQSEKVIKKVKLTR